MTTMTPYLHNPAIWLAAYFLFNAAVSNMPAPDDKSGNGYKWAYGTLHTLAGNLDKVMAMRKPQV